MLAFFLPLDGFAELSVFLVAYLIIGGDIVWRACTNIVRGTIFDEHFLMAIATIGAFAISEVSRRCCSNVVLSSRRTVSRRCC